MKLKLILFSTLVSTAVLAASAATGPDYVKIRKDLNVMSQIAKSAFQDNESCRGCDIKITSNYLASQGATFTIGTYKSRCSFSNEDDTSFIISESTFDRLTPLADLEGLEALKSLESLDSLEGVISMPDLPDMVTSILIDVGEGLEEAGANLGLLGENGYEYRWNHSSPHIRIDRTTRLESKELSREIRELEYKIREHEIELLHAEDPKERRSIEKKIAEIEKKTVKVRDTLELINAKTMAKRKAYEQKREAKRALAEQETEKLLKNVQKIVMQSFCDYGSALKHLPEDEKVSLIFTQRKKNSDTIYILDKKALSDCSSGEKLQADALSYVF
ncbi:MAG: hypothetical protein JKY88_00995 [Pseudomonadales bacterium]|nr:hypothetical protein [Pseudomonadales bacterium]